MPNGTLHGNRISPATLLAEAEAALVQEGQPLHYEEITQRILDRGRWTTDGKTPANTLNARLSTDLKRLASQSRFRRLGRGIYGLCAWDAKEQESDEEAKARPDPVSHTGDGLPLVSVLSFTDAAERVLDRFGGRQPMHYREITDKAIELGLIRTKGETPEASLNAQISMESDRQTRRGAIPRFIRYGKGMIGLSRWTEHGLASRIAEHNVKVRRRLHETLLAMPPQHFEALIGRLLVKLGFEEVTVTEYGGDGGIDVRGTLVVGGVIQTRMAVQVKRWKQNVQAPVVQQVRGSLGVNEQGLIITTADFSKGAREEAERPNRAPVALMEGKQLVALLVEHNIGVERQPHDLLMLDLSAEEE